MLELVGVQVKKSVCAFRTKVIKNAVEGLFQLFQLQTSNRNFVLTSPRFNCEIAKFNRNLDDENANFVYGLCSLII